MTTGLVHVAGEVTTSGYVDIPTIVRDRITGDRLRLVRRQWFDGRSCGVSISIGAQSPDIAQGVDDAFEVARGVETDDDALDHQGAGDQGIMFGYATARPRSSCRCRSGSRTGSSERLAEVRQHGEVDWLRPDGKTQVTIGYDGTTPRTVETVVHLDAALARRSRPTSCAPRSSGT